MGVRFAPFRIISQLGCPFEMLSPGGSGTLDKFEEPRRESLLTLAAFKAFANYTYQPECADLPKPSWLADEAEFKCMAERAIKAPARPSALLARQR